MTVTFLPLAASVEGGVRLRVHVLPGSSRNCVVGEHGGALKVRVAAPPEDGQANAELCAFLAGKLGLPKSAVSVVSGPSSRKKVVMFEGATLEQVESLIP